MENRGILNWRNWSIIRKAQVIGTLAGALFTIGTVVIYTSTGPHGLDISFALLLLTIMPTLKIFGMSIKALSADNGAGSGGDYWAMWAMFPLCLVVITNSVLGFLLGSFVGLLRNMLKRKTTQKP